MKKDVQRNLGTADRAIRTVIAAVLLVLALTKTISGGWALLVAALGMFQVIEAAAAY